MPTCSCTSGFKACDNQVAARCFVCDDMLCEGCSRLVLTKEGWVRICSCGPLCFRALQLRAARERREVAS